jgi:hypothetical protein
MAFDVQDEITLVFRDTRECRQLNFFYFDSDHPPTGSFFLGYAFADGQFYFASEPANKVLGSGFDGAYTSCVVTDDAIRFGVDWSGAGRLFYFRQDHPRSFWAVSNSFILLVERLHGKGQRLTLDPQQFSLWGYSGAFVEQMTSSDTVVSEIKLAPRWMDIVVTDFAGGGFGEISLDPRSARLKGGGDYRTVLADYISETKSRLYSLAASGSVLSFDLSGGLDSRTAFSFASALIRGNPDLAPQIRVFSNRQPGFAVDYAIAEKIVEQRGFMLSPSRERNPAVLPSGTPFRDWELNRVGQYSLATAIYPSLLDPSRIHISGAGGESYRPFWEKWSSDVSGLLKDRNSFLMAPELNKVRAAEAIQNEISFLRMFHPSSVSDLSIHYREFRARFHMGVPASEKVMLFPMAGRKMEELAAAAPPEYFENRQIYYDIIANLDPDLLAVEFDSPEKAPAPANMQRLEYVGLTDGSDTYGITVMNQVHDLPANRETMNPNDRLVSEVMQRPAYVPEWMTVVDGYIEKGLVKFRKDRRFDDQKKMHPLHFIYLRNKMLSLVPGLRIMKIGWSWFDRIVGSLKAAILRIVGTR